MRPLVILLAVACAEPQTNPPKASPAALWVLESDYNTGLISGWDESFTKIPHAEAPSDGDAHLLQIADQLVLLQRGHGDNLVLFDLDLTIRDQWALPDRSNPQDALLIGDTLWLSLYHESYILRLDANTGAALSNIDLSRFNDADQRPEASSFLHSKSGLIYLILQNLDFSGVEPIPPQQSRLLIFNSNMELIDDLAIPSNPFGSMVEQADGSILMACNSGWDIVQNAGLWRFDPQSGDGAFLVKESALGGNILSFSATQEEVFLVISKNDFSTSLRRFGLTDQQLSQEFSGPGQQLGCVQTLSDGHSWVCDRSSANFGLRHIDANAMSISNNLISTQLPPRQIIENQAP